MNLADQLKENIELQKALQKLQREIVVGHERVLIQTDAMGVYKKLKEEGFDVNMDGFQFNQGAYVGLKQKTQWGDH